MTTPISDQPADPLGLIVTERERARAAGDPMTDLCVLATAEDGGPPGVRPIVLRDIGPDGIGLLISETSPKWGPLSRGRFELLLLWLSVRRQFRVRGRLAPMPEALVTRYWEQKVHASRLLDLYYATHQGQSTVIASREAFLGGIESLRGQYPTPDSVPRPPLLRGVLLVPERVEQWRGSPDRLHDRRLFTRGADGWREHTLIP